MSMHSLPNECLGECFEQFVGSDGSDFVSLVRARNTVCSVDKKWRSIAFSIPSLWKRIVVSQQVPVDVLQLWISNAGLDSVRVEVDFHGLQKYYGHGNVSARICAYARLVVPSLMSSAGSWSSFSMEIEDGPCSQLFIVALRCLTLSSLASLSLDCPLVEGSIADVQTLVDFFRHSPLLSRLSFRSGAIAWFEPGCFRDLVSLEVRGSGGMDTIQLDGVLTLLRNSPRIEHLVLVGFHVVGLVGIGCDLVQLPLLHTLELSVGLGGGLESFAGHLELPELVNVVLELGGPSLNDSHASLRQRPGIFHGVDVLVVRTRLEDLPGWESVRLLFELFSNIKELDVTGAVPSIFGGGVNGDDDVVRLPLLCALKYSCGTIDDSVGSIAACLDAPSLVKVVLELNGPHLDFSARVYQYRTVFCHVVELEVQTVSTTWKLEHSSGLRPLFQSFSEVTHLDLLRADPFVFQALVNISLDDEGDRAALLPKLASLSVVGGINQLKDFIELRGRLPARSLSWLHIEFSSRSELDVATSRDDWEAIIMNVLTTPSVVETSMPKQFASTETVQI
ncbi:hypothetical protein C8R43DRAFT_942424 [Mycena crocata]|nr:hypothetical protein C8R43DRAFT_942424 [Mycena crocata]